ncbi:unnamed protein product [Cylindrotheca closterium]|uniref:NADAR domain-containing protein n=1 Tax=Cylindrotheca closterium TaxID=2856 RepID=A0AAD2G1V1_9STRA|nr:unnamed protein product [Cylindrotheca closterium]
MTKEYYFFWRSGSCFSQWHRSKYELNGCEYNTAEQGMMHGKARLFGDEEIGMQILATSDPRKIKQLGRKVRGFNEKEWKKNRETIVYQNNMAKFTQNEYMKDVLLSTKGALLVEASPHDRIWGIGLREEDAKKISPMKWKGQNLLGKILTRVREDIAAMECSDEIAKEPDSPSVGIDQDLEEECKSTVSAEAILA